MPNLNYFRGSPGGTGVPAGWGQATNTGMAAGISKGMDALAKGLEKFFQNKREQAEEDAYAELLEKLNELPGKTKEVGRKTSDEVMSAAMEGTQNLPEYLTKAAAEGHIEPIPGSFKGWTGDNSGFYTPHGPMPVDSSSVGTKQEMVPNPDIEGMLYDAESGEYYPHSVLPSGEFETITYPDGITEYVAGTQPAPQMIPGPTVPDFSSSVPLERPMPAYRATEAGMAGQQVPLSFAEQDQARNQLIAEYTRRIGTDRAEKLMGEQFKIHRDETGKPVFGSLGKSLQPYPGATTKPLFSEKDFVDMEINGQQAKLNIRNGHITTADGGSLDQVFKNQKDRITAENTKLKELKKLNPELEFVYLSDEGQYLTQPPSWFGNSYQSRTPIPIDEAIGLTTVEKSSSKKPVPLSEQRATDLVESWK